MSISILQVVWSGEDSVCVAAAACLNFWGPSRCRFWRGSHSADGWQVKLVWHVVLSLRCGRKGRNSWSTMFQVRNPCTYTQAFGTKSFFANLWTPLICVTKYFSFLFPTYIVRAHTQLTLHRLLMLRSHGEQVLCMLCGLFIYLNTFSLFVSVGA